MQYKKNKLVLLITLVAVVGAFGISMLRTQLVAGQQAKKSEIPTVSIDTPESTNPEERKLRGKRGGKYNTGRPITEPQNNQTDLLDLPLSHAPVETALPVQESDAVIVGTINNAQAFLSTDKSSVYSEFTVAVEEIIKGSGSANFIGGNTVIAERAGGAVRFASGLTQKRGVLGHGLPSKDKRYVLFLKWNETGQDFQIITGYELRDGNVRPLDGLEDEDLANYKNYKSYKNSNEADFLTKLRNVSTN